MAKEWDSNLHNHKHSMEYQEWRENNIWRAEGKLHDILKYRWQEEKRSPASWLRYLAYRMASRKGHSSPSSFGFVQKE